MSKKKFTPWTHEDHMKRMLNRRGLPGEISYTHKIDTITRKVFAGDKVVTPNGIGKVYLIDDDDTICVDIDKTDVLHEFDRHEVHIYKKHKKNKKKKRK